MSDAPSTTAHWRDLVSAEIVWALANRRLALLIYIAERADPKTGIATFTRKSAADALECSGTIVSQHLTTLAELGVIEVFNRDAHRVRVRVVRCSR